MKESRNENFQGMRTDRKEKNGEWYKSRMWG